MANLNHGECVIGALKGFASVQNGEFVNHSLAVVSRQYQDKYGDLQQETIEVEVPKQRAEEVKKFVEGNVGNMVQVSFYSNVLNGVKNGKPWAFNKRTLLPNTQINLVSSK